MSVENVVSLGLPVADNAIRTLGDIEQTRISTSGQVEQGRLKAMSDMFSARLAGAAQGYMTYVDESDQVNQSLDRVSFRATIPLKGGGIAEFNLSKLDIVFMLGLERAYGEGGEGSRGIIFDKICDMLITPEQIGSSAFDAPAARPAAPPGPLPNPLAYVGFGSYEKALEEWKAQAQLYQQQSTTGA